MPEKISWTMQLQIEGGPSFRLAQKIESQAYDKFSVTVPEKPEGMQVNIPLKNATLLLVRCIKDAASSEVQITCSIDEDTATYDLAEVPLIVIGEGLIKKLASDKTEPTLKFTNGSDSEVTIDILVCRDLPPE